MKALTEILRENVGKSSYEMKNFFQGLVKKKELNAYSVELDKKIVEKDNSDETVVRTKKGAILTKINKLGEVRSVILEDPETGRKYNLDINSRGGMFYDDGDSQTVYHGCVLELLNNRFDPKKVGAGTSYNNLGSFNDGIVIPQEMVSARLRVSYDEGWGSAGDHDIVTGTSKRLVVEGKKDDLFDKVIKFVRGE